LRWIRVIFPDILDFIDHTHPTTADLLDDAVVAQFKANAQILA